MKRLSLSELLELVDLFAHEAHGVLVKKVLEYNREDDALAFWREVASLGEDPRCHASALMVKHVVRIRNAAGRLPLSEYKDALIDLYNYIHLLYALEHVFSGVEGADGDAL